jgi:thiamine biosynthesis lipoprotein
MKNRGIMSRISSTLQLFLFNFLVLLPGKLSAQANFKPFYISGYAQGTTYHVTYYAKDSVVLAKDIDHVLDEIDSSLSVYKPYSLISKFNDARCTEVVMDKHLGIVVRKSIEIYHQSGGLFDITVYPLTRAWGFGNKKIKTYPDSAMVKAMLACVGSDKLMIQGNRLIKKTPCVQIDVDGIAQGYSVDVVADFLESRGIRNYLVEIGGEIRVKGKRQPENTTMQIGIEGPAKNPEDEPVLQKIIELQRGGLTTSGNYRKYFKSRNKVMSHLMDPKTGYPLQNELIAVTVLARDALTADGYDNPLMSMGLERGLQFLKQHKEMEAYFIYHKPDGSIADTASKGFYRYMK